MMMGRSIAITVLVAVCVTFSGCPCVKATWHWIPWDYPPTLLQPLPEICGLRVVVGNRTFNTSILSRLPPNVNLIRFRLPDDSPVEHLHTLESGISPGSVVPGSFRRWLVRIGDNAAGALISPQHVITLAPCLAEYRRWFAGYYRFAVQISDQLVQVSRIRVQRAVGNPFPLAFLTLGSHNLTKAIAPACVGVYRAGLVARSITWTEKEGMLQEHPITVYPHWHCSWYEDGFVDNLMLCGSPGPALCGSPLVQVENDRWMLVGLGTGDVSEVVTYIRLGPSREWIKELFFE